MGDRGASEVLSFALVFSLVVTSVAIISVSGLDSLRSTRDAEQMNNAERAFDVLADNLDDIYQEGAPSRATEISLEGAQLVADENVTINVSAEDSVGNLDVVEHEVRPIIYQGQRDRKIVYEAGALFRTNRDDGLVLDEPPFMFNVDFYFLQIAATKSDHVEGAGGGTVLLRAQEHDSNVSIADTSNDYVAVFVNVSSPRANLWGEYLDETDLTEYKTGTNADGVEFVTYRKTLPPGRVFVVSSEITITIDR